MIVVIVVVVVVVEVVVEVVVVVVVVVVIVVKAGAFVRLVLGPSPRGSGCNTIMQLGPKKHVWHGFRNLSPEWHSIWDPKVEYNAAAWAALDSNPEVVYAKVRMPQPL